MTDQQPTNALPDNAEGLGATLLQLLQDEVANRDIVLTRDMTMTDSGVDSVDVLQLMLKIEEVYGIEIDQIAGRDFATVGDLIDGLIGMMRPLAGRPKG